MISKEKILKLFPRKGDIISFDEIASNLGVETNLRSDHLTQQEMLLRSILKHLVENGILKKLERGLYQRESDDDNLQYSDHFIREKLDVENIAEEFRSS